MSDSTFNRKTLSLKRKRPQAPAKEENFAQPSSTQGTKKRA